MTREQQKKIRELRTALPKILQAEIRQYKFRKKDYMVWVKKNELFFTFFPFISEQNGKCILFIQQQFKPMWIDDLFWDLIDMSENKNEPESLRSVGAFTVRGAQLFDEEIELNEWSIEELTDKIRNSIKDFNDRICSFRESDFNLNINNPLYHKDIRNLLLMIYNKEYEKAIEYAESMEYDGFVNKGIGLREAAVIYCRRSMSDDLRN